MHLNIRCCQCKHWNRFDDKPIGRCEALPKIFQENAYSNEGCGSGYQLNIQQLEERYGPDYLSIVSSLSK